MKYFTLLFCTMALLISSVNAKDKIESLQNKVDLEFSNNIINRLESIQNSSILPGAPQNDDMTSILWEAKVNWGILSQSAKDKIERLQGNLGELQFNAVSKDGYFKFHFTDTGDDAIDLTDDDGDEMPNIVEFYDSCFCLAAANYKAAGFAMPYVKDYYDVYLSTSSCSAQTYGYTTIDLNSNPKIGDNPNSPEKEVNSYKSYIVIRTDFTGFSSGYEWSVKITSAHEFFHAVQMSIDYIDGSLRTMFVMEGCAVWSENWNYPDNYDGFQYMSNYYNFMDMQLNYQPTGGQDDKYYIRPYGTWLFFRYITDLYGDNTIKKIYYNHIGKTQNDAFKKTFTDLGTDYLSVLKNFFVSQYMMCKIDGQKPLYWSLADTMSKISSCDPRYEKTFILNPGTPVTYNSATTGNKRFQMMSADYFRINYNSGATVTVQGQNSKDTMAVYLIQSDKDKNPTKMNLVSAMAYGTAPISLHLGYDPSMPKLNLVLANLRLANDPTSNTSYNIELNPDLLDVQEANYSQFTINGINPMPADENSSLNITTKDFGLYNYSIFDLSGKEVLNGAFFSNNLNNIVPMNLKDLNSGMYLIQVTNGKETQSINFIVK